MGFYLSESATDIKSVVEFVDDVKCLSLCWFVIIELKLWYCNVPADVSVSVLVSGGLGVGVGQTFMTLKSFFHNPLSEILITETTDRIFKMTFLLYATTVCVYLQTQQLVHHPFWP